MELYRPTISFCRRRASPARPPSIKLGMARLDPARRLGSGAFRPRGCVRESGLRWAKHGIPVRRRRRPRWGWVNARPKRRKKQDEKGGMHQSLSQYLRRWSLCSCPCLHKGMKTGRQAGRKAGRRQGVGMERGEGKMEVGCGEGAAEEGTKAGPPAGRHARTRCMRANMSRSDPPNPCWPGSRRRWRSGRRGTGGGRRGPSPAAAPIAAPPAATRRRVASRRHRNPSPLPTPLLYPSRATAHAYARARGRCIAPASTLDKARPGREEVCSDTLSHARLAAYGLPLAPPPSDPPSRARGNLLPQDHGPLEPAGDPVGQGLYVCVCVGGESRVCARARACDSACGEGVVM